MPYRLTGAKGKMYENLLVFSEYLSLGLSNSTVVLLASTTLILLPDRSRYIVIGNKVIMSVLANIVIVTSCVITPLGDVHINNVRAMRI